MSWSSKMRRYRGLEVVALGHELLELVRLREPALGLARGGRRDLGGGGRGSGALPAIAREARAPSELGQNAGERRRRRRRPRGASRHARRARPRASREARGERRGRRRHAAAGTRPTQVGGRLRRFASLLETRKKATGDPRIRFQRAILNPRSRVTLRDPPRRHRLPLPPVAWRHLARTLRCYFPTAAFAPGCPSFPAPPSHCAIINRVSHAPRPPPPSRSSVRTRAVPPSPPTPPPAPPTQAPPRAARTREPL